MAGEKQITPVDDVEAICQRRDLDLPAPGPYRDYIEWLRRHDFLRDKCVQELFETQVECTPNTVALVYIKEEVSYRELDNQTNRAARHLRSLYSQLPPKLEARAAKLCWSSPLTTSIFAWPTGPSNSIAARWSRDTPTG